MNLSHALLAARAKTDLEAVARDVTALLEQRRAADEPPPARPPADSPAAASFGQLSLELDLDGSAALPLDGDFMLAFCSVLLEPSRHEVYLCGPGKAALFEALDCNRDGQVSKQEWKRFFNTWHKSGSGLEVHLGLLGLGGGSEPAAGGWRRITPLELDKQALLALHRKTGGSSTWLKIKTQSAMTGVGWLTSDDVRMWPGVTVEAGRVTKLDLPWCGLSGPIPPEIGSMNCLRYLNLRGNNLTGAIPEEIGNLTQLSELHLWQNKLTGALPVETLGKLTSLAELRLYSNKLTCASRSQRYFSSRPLTPAGPVPRSHAKGQAGSQGTATTRVRRAPFLGVPFVIRLRQQRSPGVFGRAVARRLWRPRRGAPCAPPRRRGASRLGPPRGILRLRGLRAPHPSCPQRPDRGA